MQTPQRLLQGAMKEQRDHECSQKFINNKL